MQQVHFLAHDSWINFCDISANGADKTLMLVKHAPAVDSYGTGRGMQDLLSLQISIFFFVYVRVCVAQQANVYTCDWLTVLTRP